MILHSSRFREIDGEEALIQMAEALLTAVKELTNDNK
jgi:hypothetical protein